MDILMKLQLVNDLKVSKVGEDYLIESKSKDSYCVLNGDGYHIIEMINVGKTGKEICESTLDKKKMKIFLDKLYKLGFITNTE